MKIYLYTLFLVLMGGLNFSPVGQLQGMENKRVSIDEQSKLIEELLNRIDALFKLNGMPFLQSYYKSVIKGDILRENYGSFNFPNINFDQNIPPEENKKGIQDVLNVLFQMEWLWAIRLVNIELETVPPGIENLKNLERLNLSDNNLKTVSGELIKSLESLQEIDLTNNPILPQSGDYLNWGIKELSENGFIKEGAEGSLIFKNIRKIYVGYSYDKDQLNNYTQYFFSDLPNSEKQRNPVIIEKNLKEIASKVIVNEEGLEKKRGYNYSDLKSALESDPGLFKMGAPLYIPPGTYEIPAHVINEKRSQLKIDEDIPIGYQIYIPKQAAGKNIKGIYVKVYGGNLRNELLSSNDDDELAIKYLLDNGVVVIYLNLLDLYALKRTFQAHMPLDLHEKLHLSIDYFLKTLKDNPQLLGFDKTQIQNKKVILAGRSFGGRTAIRHAELYPNTFDGYISDDGVLDLEKWNTLESKSFQGFQERKVNLSAWIDPAPQFWIEKIKDPILLLQNFDDNNVGAQLTISWYKNATRSHKQLQLLVTPKGNPMPERSDSLNKGHYTPVDKIAFENYMNTILHFIQYGPSKLGVMSEWSAEKYNIYASAFLNRNYESLSLTDKFLSWAFRLYRARSSDNSMGSNIHISWKIFKNKDITTETIYDALAYLEENKNPILGPTDLSDDVILKMLTYHLPLFIEYLRERNMINPKVSDEAVARLILDDKNIIPQYRELLVRNNLDPLLKKYLVRILYIANPSLLDSFRKAKFGDENYKAAKNKALKAFDDLVERQTKIYPKKAWEQLGSEVLRMNKVKQQAAQSLLSEAKRRKQEKESQTIH